MMKLLCLALILFVKLNKVISSDELPAYINFFDNEDEMSSDDLDFKNREIVHPALFGPEKTNSLAGIKSKNFAPLISSNWWMTLPKFNDEKDNTFDAGAAKPSDESKSKNFEYFGSHNVLMSEPKFDSEKEKLTTTHFINDDEKENIIFRIHKGKSTAETLTPNIENTLRENNQEHIVGHGNTILYNGGDKIAEKHNAVPDFFAELIKFCVESIGLVLNSFMGLIKPNSTEIPSEDYSFGSVDELYDVKPYKMHPQNIKKRDVTEPPTSESAASLNLVEVKVPVSKIAGQTLENIIENTLENNQKTTEGTISLLSENSEASITVTLPTSSSSRDSSDVVELGSSNVQVKEETSEHTKTTLKHEETTKVSLGQQVKPLSSDITQLGEMIKATETSGITTKLINNQMLNDMQEDDLNAKLRFLPFEEEIMLEQEKSSSSMFVVGGTLLVVAILASAGTAAAYKYRQRVGQPHGITQNPIIA